MTTEGLKALAMECAVGAGEREITGGFCGDLLSWVMGRAKSGDCWFTVMGNLNTVAVAALTDVAAVVLCQGVVLPDAAIERAREEGINIFYSADPVFAAAAAFYEIWKQK